MNNGYIKLNKKILNWEWIDKPNTFALFIYLLLKASWKDTEWHGIKIKRGQLITGRQKLSKETGLSERKIRTALSDLQTTNNLTIKTTNKYSLITIVNYDKYQCSTINSDQQNDQQNVQQTTTSNKYKNIKKEYISKDIYKKETHKYFTKPTITELQDYINDNNFNVDADRFIDYYESNGWKVGKSSMKDWKATVRNWNRKETDNDKGEYKPKIIKEGNSVSII